MRFYNIEMRGPLKVQNATGAPSFSASDEGRLTYYNGELYVNDSSQQSTFAKKNACNYYTHRQHICYDSVTNIAMIIEGVGYRLLDIRANSSTQQAVLIKNEGTATTLRVNACGGGTGICATSLCPGGYAICACACDNPAIRGESVDEVGIWGSGETCHGVYGRSYADGTDTTGSLHLKAGVFGDGRYNSHGIQGQSCYWTGVYGCSMDYIGVHGQSDNWVGVYGSSVNGTAIGGTSTYEKAAEFHADNYTGYAVNVISCLGGGILINSPSCNAICSNGTIYSAVTGSNYGVYGHSATYFGIRASAADSHAAYITNSCLTTTCEALWVWSPGAPVGAHIASTCTGAVICGAICYGIYAATTCCYGVYGNSSCVSGLATNNTIACTSSKNLKYLQDICLTDCIKNTPIKTYKYYWEDSNTKGFDLTVGPTAESFNNTFKLTNEMNGDDYENLWSVDGVAFGLGLENLKEIDKLKVIVKQLYGCIQKLEGGI